MSDKEQIDEAFGRDGKNFALFKTDFQGKPTFVLEERDASGQVVKSSGFESESDARDEVKKKQGSFFMQQSRSTVPATADLGKPASAPSSTGGVSQPGADVTTGDNTPDNASAPNPATTPVKEATEPVPGSQNDPETNATPKQDI